MGGCYDLDSNTNQGVIPRVVQELFIGMAERPDYSFCVKVSYLEVHVDVILKRFL